MKAIQIVVLALMIVFISCGPRSGRIKTEPSGTMAERVWAHVMAGEGYRQWQHYPGGKGLCRGNSPHGDYVKLFINKPTYKAFRKEQRLPFGAMLVQENYSFDGKTLMNITLMYKIEEYNPENGDWYWAKYDPAGSPVTSGRVNSCIQCHRMLGRNYIIQ